jgi:hypothetical protein
MCSITDRVGGTSTGAALALLVEHFGELADTIATRVGDADADLAGLPVDAVAGPLRSLLVALDQGRASAAVLTGVVHRGATSRQLIEGTYASARRFLEVEAGMSEQSAKALAARAHDLADATDDGDPRVRDAWLAGELSDDKVRVLTVGIREATKHTPIARRAATMRAGLDIVLPLARSGTVADLRLAVGRLRFVLDPDGVRQAELDAYTEQTLTCVRVGHLMQLRAFLDPEAAAAIMTVLTQQVEGWRAAGDLAVEDRLPDGVDPGSAEGRRLGRARSAHLLALALGEVMTGQLGRSDVGMHHGIRPHTVMHVDARDLLLGLGGELTMPGPDDPVLISSDTVRRVLCDTGLTYLITQPVAGRGDPGAHGAATALPDQLRERAVDVLYVGREFRTAPPRLRRALEARDRQCQAPGCGRHPRRCIAHHVQHWEHGGDTTIANCLLLCERHHRALHAGALTITRDTSKRPTETGYFQVHPPDRPARP